MAEPTLALDFDGLLDAISYFLWGTPDYDNLSAADKVTAAAALQSGYRLFIYPPATRSIEAGYEWRFMTPWESLTTIAPYETGTVTVVTTTCTLAGGGTWPSWAATNGILTIDGTEYTVTTRDNDTQLTVSAEGDVAAGTSYSLAHDGDYDLNDNVGRIIAAFHWGRGVQNDPVRGDVGYGRILNLRNFNDESGEPRQWAQTIESLGAASTGHRRKIHFYPRPDDDYTLWYRYEEHYDQIADAEYPAGMVKHVETLRLACLAAADRDVNDAQGVYWAQFLEALEGSIKRDKREGMRVAGTVGGFEAFKGSSGYRDRYHDHADHAYGLTVNGTTIQ